MSKDCLLSLALIMRDAAGEVLGCLKSVAEAVDEMVVVDTGSVDDSVAVVKGYLEQWQKEKPGRQWQLGGIKWRDDFAHAKNQALLRCHGKYVIFMDSDERFTEETRGNLRPLVENLARGGWPDRVKLQRLPDRPQTPPASGPDVLEIWRENVDLDGSPVPHEKGDSASRIIRRQPDLVYQGEVHEQVVFTDGRPRAIGTVDKGFLQILHTGYRPGVKEQKEERNGRILLKEEREGGSTRLKDFYLADLHLDRKEWRQAIGAAQRCLNGLRPVHYKNAPYCIILKSLQGLERETLQKLGLPPHEGMNLPEQTARLAAAQELQDFRSSAEMIISGAMREFPEYPEAYYYRGIRRRNGGDKAGAWSDLLKARELAELFPAKYPEEFAFYQELMPELKKALAGLEKDRQEHPQDYQRTQEPEAGAEHWQIYVARAETLGGRAIRKQLSLGGDIYRVLEETSAGERQAEQRIKGLLLPFLEITEDTVKEYLPKVALSLQNARDFHRIVVMLREPLTEVLALLSRHQERGLPCTAVCAPAGVLFGGEKEGELTTCAEELLALMSERVQSSSPRKRLLLPFRESESLKLKSVWDLAKAAIYVLRHDEGQVPLLLEGEAVTYGQVAGWAREAMGFAGRLQFGKGRLPKEAALPAGLRKIQVSGSVGLEANLMYLARRRQHPGRVFLSACVIMRDSEADIARCLESLHQADEIIVVDTGSVDKSVEIAKRYTDKVYHFEWIDDFAAAKNFALDQARGDFIVFPDSDEFFTEASAERLHRLAEDYDAPGRERQFLVRLLNVDRDFRPLGEEAACRFFSRGVRFRGMVHEVMVASDGECPLVVDIPRERCLMKHTGYDPGKMQEKQERNARLLRQYQATGGDVPLRHYNLGKIFSAEEKYEEARAEMMLARREEVQPANLRAEIYRIWYGASKKLGDEKAMDDAVAAMRQDMPLMPDSYAVEGAKLWEAGRKQEAIPLLLRALELSRDFLQHNPRELNQVEKDMPRVAQVLAGYYEEQGEKELAQIVRNLLTAS